MGTIADKLKYLSDTKEEIKQAIIDKGVAVEDDATFRSYARKIGTIQTGDLDLPLSVFVGTYENADINISYTFNNDYTAICKAGGVSFDGTFTIKGNVVTFTNSAIAGETTELTHSYVDGKDMLNDGSNDFEKTTFDF
jgi:hypothetical protein